jgi:hypothetical protein
LGSANDARSFDGTSSLCGGSGGVQFLILGLKFYLNQFISSIS